MSRSVRIDAATSAILALLSADALHWFIVGEYVDHTTMRSLLVAAQLILCAAFAVYLWPRSEEASKPAV